MKPILKKYLAIGSMILLPVGIISLTTGLYFGSNSPERISKNGIYSVKINETLNNEGYKYDLSATYGNITSTSKISLLLTNELLHLKSEGEFKYDQKTGKVIQPSYESYKFGLANSIVLTFTSIDSTNKNNSTFQLIFDNDDDEITPAFDSNTNSQIVVSKVSKNPKSINNQDVFWKIISAGYLSKEIDLNNSNVANEIDTNDKKFILTNMGLTFDTGAKWVDSNGNETKYDICAEDMFYSIKRTWLFDKNYRQSHGGSKELDGYFVSKTQTTKLFGETQKFPNEYLFDFFGIIKNNLYKKETAIQKVSKNGNEVDAFIFSFDIFDQNGKPKTDVTFSVSDIIKKYLSNSLTFSLAPSQYIKEKHANNNIENNISGVGNISGEAKEFAIYTYGQTREETLYASCYIPVSSEAGREIYEYNKYYANKEWVDSVEKGVVDKDGKIYKTINKVILDYTGGIDSSTFINQTFNSFLSGTTSEMDYSLLSDAQKQKLYGSSLNQQELIINSEKNGLRATKSVNTSKLTSRTVWQANPKDGLQYSFNDAYARLVYGSSVSELSEGKNSTANSFFGGRGLNFRNLIQASINWDYYIQWAYSGTRDAWLSGAAQDAIFSSTDANSLTPVLFNEKGLNDLFYINDKGEQKTVTLSEMKKLTSMTGEELDKEYGSGTSLDMQLAISRSPKYAEIQASVRKILDDFYSENEELDPSKEKDKIDWEIPYSFADQDETKCNATEYMVVKVINGLDPRLNARFLKPTSRNEMLAAINQKRGAYNANLWGYDYEGIGSYIAAFTSDGSGSNVMGAIGIFSKDTSTSDSTLFDVKNNRLSKDEVNKLQSLYPKFTELAKFVAQKVNDELSANNANVYDAYKPENWDLISNKDMNNIVAFFKDETNNPNNVAPISLLPVIFKMFESESSWEKDNNKSAEEKGQAWADLIKEINSIKGVSIDTESSVDKLTNVNYVLYLSEYVIPVSKYGINLYSDYKYEVNK
ncbi:MAG: hypothetical protein HDR43_02745 [Mycoplasma sp.]|nr:hypothetical protein [Mycoplasma sp.]